MKKTKFLSKVFYIIIYIFCYHYAYGIDFTSGDSTKVLTDSLDDNKRVVYKLNPIADIPIVVLCGSWSGYLLATKISNKTNSTPEQILNLNTNDVNFIDRLGIYPYNSYLDKLSYYPFYAAIPLPLVFFLTGNDMRNDFLKLGFLYLETLSVTGLFGTSATFFVDRYRPYTYTPTTSMDKKISSGSKNSFYAGHVEIVSTSTFFISEVYSSYYPESKIKWLFFGLSGAATAGMGYMRSRAGMHFPSDIFLGAATGTLSGILVPYFQNHKIIKTPNLSFVPFGGNTFQGISMIYTFQNFKI
jgi:membrane-associated phospholipid phosphatase